MDSEEEKISDYYQSLYLETLSKESLSPL
jgi:hypothetical protein